MRNKYNNKISSLVMILALLIISVSKANAQTPGGTGLTTEIWLSADKVNGTGGTLPANGASVTTWSPVISGGRSYVQNNHGTATYNAVPTFTRSGINLMNFQPHLNFGADATKLVNTSDLLGINNAYYIFYVSRTASSAANRTVFTISANNGTVRNNSVGWDNGLPYLTLGSVGAGERVHQGNGNLYGINAAIMPNSTSTVPSSYMNGVKNSSNFAARVFATGTFNMSVIGNANYDNSYPFTGDIQELIVLSASNGSTIDAMDLTKINTYLAIKYGISLASGDYVDGSGNTVWERSRSGFNEYNNNIFGLAYDSNSGLHQKQAQNTESKELVMYVGDLATLNIDNSSNSLNDGDYLLLGSNVGRNSTNYVYSAGTNFDEGTLEAEVNKRKNLIFRAQTGASRTSFSDVKIVTDAMYVIVSPNDPDFAPGNTRLYKVDENTGVATVTINDGDYIGFAMYEGMPGGLSTGLELWLSADNLTAGLGMMPSDNEQVTQWSDQSENLVNFTTISTTYPRYNYNGMNYNPSVNFDIEGEDFAATDSQKKLTAPFTTSSSKSYYSFWVSEVDPEKAGGTTALPGETSSTESVVFTFHSTNDNNNHGWDITRSATADPQVKMETSTAGYFETFPTNPNNSAYGIASIMRPNDGTAAVTQTQYFNGVANSVRGRALTNATSTAVIGNSVATTTGNTRSFFGDVQEIIVYSGTAGQTMDEDNIHKIHSYLAIKYGISLDNQDLINASGTVVWNGVDNKNDGYKKNVFGLARDKYAGLYVKQATSADYRSFSVFVGEELADLNVNNTGSLREQEFIMFGSNGELEGLESYYYKEGEGNFLNGSVGQDINYKRKLVFKTQITGTQTSYFVNMAAPARYVLVSPTDPTFAPENTYLYEVDKTTGYAMDVELQDGYYIGFATFEYAPGGVINGLRTWLKADDIESITKDGEDKISVWRDQTSNNNHFSLADVTYSSKTNPLYVACDDRMNFQPSIMFDVNAYLGIRRGPMSMNAPDDFTSFAVYYNTMAYSTARLYTHGFGGINPSNSSTRYPAMGFAPGATTAGGGGRIRNDGAGLTNANGNVVGFRKNTTALQMIHTQKQAKTGTAKLTYDFGGWQDNTTYLSLSTFGNGFRMSRGATLGGASIAGTGSSSGSFVGLIPEIFFYESELSSEDQDKIRTYLGIKYGITLDANLDNPSINYDYVLSDGQTKVWEGNSAPNIGYHNNVVGLVRDDNSNMYINKGRSSADGAVFTMMVRGHNECSQGDASMLVNDLSGLFWGNNGDKNEIPLDPSDPNICGEMEKKLGQIWLVDKTNLDKLDVTILMAQTTNTSSFPYASAGYKVTLLVADSPEKLVNNEWDMAIPASYVKEDKGHRVDFTFTEKYTYLAIGVKALPGACETCDFEGSKTVTFNRNTWTNGDLERDFNLGTDSLGNTFSVNVKSSIETNARWSSRYPRYSTRNSLRQRRTGSTAPLMITEITPTKAAAVQFQIFNLDREGSRYKQVEIYGECEGAPIYPTLTAVRPQERRRSFDIAGNIAKAKRTPTSGYASDPGKLNVIFEHPVEKIFIKENATGATSGSQDYGISPISFTCPAPIPPFNEAGLAMSKQATDTVKLCTTETLLDYTFRIFNANCSQKGVTVRDTLPAGLSWDIDLISIDEIAYGDDTKITISDDKKILVIDSLMVPGAAEPFLFTAQAIFDADATSGIYENQAWMTTTLIKDNLPVEVPAYPTSDFHRGDGQKSRTVAIDGGVRLSPVTVRVTKSKDCYAAANEITVTLTIDNPTTNNQAISDIFLDFNYNEEFEYVNNSLTSSISGIPSNPEFDVEGATTYPGYFFIEGFELPIGSSTISFTLKAPAQSALARETDASGNPIDWDGNILTGSFNPEDQAVVELNIAYDFSTGMDEECISATLLRANGDIVIPFCQSKECVITNIMLQPRLK